MLKDIKEDLAKSFLRDIVMNVLNRRFEEALKFIEQLTINKDSFSMGIIMAVKGLISSVKNPKDTISIINRALYSMSPDEVRSIAKKVDVKSHDLFIEEEDRWYYWALAIMLEYIAELKEKGWKAG